MIRMRAKSGACDGLKDGSKAPMAWCAHRTGADTARTTRRASPVSVDRVISVRAISGARAKKSASAIVAAPTMVGRVG